MKTLVAEDNAISGIVLQRILKKVGSCVIAHDGEEAFNLFKDALDNGVPFDLVCLDIIMPILDGQAALRLIREEEERHGIYGLDQVKIIMTTGMTDSDYIFSSFREQCDAYIRKPVESRFFLDQLRKLGFSVDDATTS